MTSTPPIRWGMGDAVVGFVAAQVTSTVVVVVLLAATGRDELSTSWLVVPQLFMWASLLGAPLVATSTKGRRSLRDDFGLDIRWADARWAMAGVACQLVVLPTMYAVIEWMVGDLDVGAPARDLAEDVSGVAFVVFALLVTFVAPMIEEIFYRGLVLRAAARRWTDGFAIALSSVWFGSSHFQLVQLPALITAGLVFALAAARSGRLGPAIAAHAGFNAVTVVALGVG